MRVAETIKEILSFEAREARFNALFYATKETLKTFIQSFQNVLANLRVNVFVFGISRFNFGKLVGLVVVVQRYAIELVSLFSFGKCGVIQISAKKQSLLKFLGLSFAWEDSELERFCYTIFSHFNSTKVILVRLLREFAVLFEAISIIRHKTKIHNETDYISTQTKKRVMDGVLS